MWRQTNGDIDAFVSGAGTCQISPFSVTMPYLFIGTGGTLAGIGRFLKSVKKSIRVVLADPEGSGLYNKVFICCAWILGLSSSMYLNLTQGQIWCNVRYKRK